MWGGGTSDEPNTVSPTRATVMSQISVGHMLCIMGFLCPMPSGSHSDGTDTTTLTHRAGWARTLGGLQNLGLSGY